MRKPSYAGLTLLLVLIAAAVSAAETKGYLGIQTKSNRDVVEQKHAAPGLTVTSVVENSPGEAAGVKEGDILLQANGADLIHPNQLLDLAETLPVGSAIRLKIDRDQEMLEVSATTVARIAVAKAPEPEASKTWIERRLLFIEVGALNPEDAVRLGLKPREGIRLTHLNKESPLRRAGAKEGSVIGEVNGKPIHSPEDFLKGIQAASPGDTLKLRLANEKGDWKEKQVRLAGGETQIKKIGIPLLFGYERAPNKSSLTLPLYLFMRERIEDSCKYRILWFFAFETGRSDELLEVQ